MRPCRSLIPLALALLAAGCADETGPQNAVRQPVAAAPHFLQWAGGSSPQFTTIGAVADSAGGGGLLAASSRGLSASLSGLSLNQYVATFWAVRGQQRSVQINYLSFTGDTSSPFLRLTTVDPTYAPGQGDLAPGDSVLITVTIDPNNIKVSLEPTGLVFGDPAQLEISYGGAGGDLNGDGVVDDADAYIEGQLLGLWYREGPDSTWAPIPALHSLSDKAFASALPHFCEYAISW
jgi:hypothetical protein